MAKMSLIDRPTLESAVRSFWSYTCDTNPLPIWDHYGDVKGNVVPELQKRMEGLLAGDVPLPNPLVMDIPDRPGRRSTWHIPSINMQLVLQYCASALAPELHKRLDSERVYSYRNLINDFTFDGLFTSWVAFEQTTFERLDKGASALKLDLARAFPSVNRKNFFAMARETGKETATDLFENVLTCFGNTGLPLVNDSIMVLGNAYLAKVDKIVRRHCPDFIRFMDDYRLFCTTRTAEKLYVRISQDLVEETEFRINEEKLAVLERGDCCLPMSVEKVDVSGSLGQDVSGSLGLFAVGQAAEPEILRKLIEQALQRPNQCMTVRTGRAILGAVQRERLKARRLESDKAKKAPRRLARRKRAKRRVGISKLSLDQILEWDSKIRGGFLRQVQRLGGSENEQWRMIWLLYVFKNLFDTHNANTKERNEVENLRGSKHEIVRRWADRLIAGSKRFDGELFELQDLPYIDQGKFSGAAAQGG